MGGEGAPYGNNGVPGKSGVLEDSNHITDGRGLHRGNIRPPPESVSKREMIYEIISKDKGEGGGGIAGIRCGRTIVS